jgi:hypothetical protein
MHSISGPFAILANNSHSWYQRVGGTQFQRGGDPHKAIGLEWGHIFLPLGAVFFETAELLETEFLSCVGRESEAA